MSESRFFLDCKNVVDIQTSRAYTFDLVEDARECCNLLNSLSEENEQLRKEKQQYKTIAEQYRKTVQHQAKLLADATKKGYCPKVINPITGEEL